MIYYNILCMFILIILLLFCKKNSYENFENNKLNLYYNKKIDNFFNRFFYKLPYDSIIDFKNIAYWSYKL